jgi:hypothetical protein
VSQLATAQRALDAGDLQAARQAAEAALSFDPGNAAARQVLERIAAAGKPSVAPAPETPTPSPHDTVVDRAAWSTFEQRVRARRADRCAARVREAHERGDLDSARAALAELCELAPDDERIAPLSALLSPPPDEVAFPFPTEDQSGEPPAVALGGIDWSDIWLDEPRLTIELDARDEPTASGHLSRPASVFTTAPQRARRSRPLAALALVTCAIAAGAAAIWIAPDRFPLRSAADLLRSGSAANEGAADESLAEPEGSLAESESMPSGAAASSAAASDASSLDSSRSASLSTPPQSAPSVTPSQSALASTAERTEADERRSDVRPEEKPAAVDDVAQAAARAPERTNGQPLATAGTASTAESDTAAPASLVASARRDDSASQAPVTSPVASPTASRPASQAAAMPSGPAPAPQPVPGVSGARSLPGVTSTLPAAPPYVTPPASPTATASARRADTPPPRDDGALVRAAIEGYRRAYNTLDAGAAAKVWPTVDAAALARAFRQLRSQSLTFDRCAVDIGGELARVECDGESEWVPGVGDSSPRTARRTWHFDLSRADAAWTIVRVNVSQ